MGNLASTETRGALASFCIPKFHTPVIRGTEESLAGGVIIQVIHRFGVPLVCAKELSGMIDIPNFD